LLFCYLRTLGFVDDVMELMGQSHARCCFVEFARWRHLLGSCCLGSWWFISDKGP